MKILIGCEESQEVTKAFRKLGFEAFSCDLKPCSGGHPEWHLQMDVYQAIDLHTWNFIGLHPECTKMTLSGNRHYASGKQKHYERIEAVEWTIKLWDYACSKSEHVYMENPMGAMNTDKRLPRPQIIQPYFFGDPEIKKTCLWIKGLPFLYYTLEDNLWQLKTSVEPEYILYKSKKSKSGFSKYGKITGSNPSTNNEVNRALRSKTYPGIAKAMAEQWGKFLTETTLTL